MTSEPSEIDYEDGLQLVPRLVAKGQMSNAVRWVDELCRHRPDDARPHNQAGLVRQRLNNPGEAVVHFCRALVLEPDAGEVWANLGTARRHVAEFEAAFICRLRSVRCRPELLDARSALGLSLLAAGDYREGFAEYEHRPERRITLKSYAALGLRAWDGKYTDRARRLLVVTEQGAGDTVQFLRFVPLLVDRGVEVVVACHENLERLVRSASGVATTVPLCPTEPPVGFDGVEMLMSLPTRLDIDRESLPAPTRYLTPAEPQHRLPDNGVLRVGLCWTGRPEHSLNALRQISFDELAPLLAIPQLEFYSLQVSNDEQTVLNDGRVTDLAPYIDDFADTAAMIDQMDLIITVDTSVAHIAGALGVPVWTLLAQVADWRWGYDSESTPWYRTMRLFRQTSSGDWRDVVDRIASELRGFAVRHTGGFRRRPFASLDPSG
ncbi:TPR repeat protein [alpha proteobacterium BAL199]|nr:TPR repeat protein [alpha proteobacterium BAL199]